MKRLIVLILAVVLGTAAMAQDKQIKIGLGGGLAIPTGTLRDYGKLGFDIYGEGLYGITPNIDLGIGYNYVDFAKKDVFGFSVKNKVHAFTVKSYYTFGNSNFRPYVMVDLGLYHLIEDYQNLIQTDKVKRDRFGAGIGLGVNLSGVKIGASYHTAASDFRYFEVNLGYTFAF